MIVDTSALVAILFREPEAALFLQTMEAAPSRRISAGSFLELAFVLSRQVVIEVERQSEALLRRAELEIEPFTIAQAHLARQAFHDFGKGRHCAGLNFGDCFAYALAKDFGEPLLFKGDDFRHTDVLAAI